MEEAEWNQIAGSLNGTWEVNQLSIPVWKSRRSSVTGRHSHISSAARWETECLDSCSPHTTAPPALAGGLTFFLTSILFKLIFHIFKMELWGQVKARDWDLPRLLLPFLLALSLPSRCGFPLPLRQPSQHPFWPSLGKPATVFTNWLKRKQAAPADGKVQAYWLRPISTE